MCRFTQPCQDASKSQTVWCMLGPHCPVSCSGWKYGGWRHITTRMCADYELSPLQKGKSTTGNTTLRFKEQSILKSSEHATQKVAYKTQSHWVDKSLENIISPLHFTYRKTKKRGTNPHVEGSVTENDAGRIQAVGQTPRPWTLQRKSTHLAIPVTWWPAFQQPRLLSTHLNCLNK